MNINSQTTEYLAMSKIICCTQIQIGGVAVFMILKISDNYKMINIIRDDLVRICCNNDNKPIYKASILNKRYIVCGITTLHRNRLLLDKI